MISTNAFSFGFGVIGILRGKELKLPNSVYIQYLYQLGLNRHIQSLTYCPTNTPQPLQDVVQVPVNLQRAGQQPPQCSRKEAVRDCRSQKDQHHCVC